jgi:lipid-A-disaccharide synthase
MRGVILAVEPSGDLHAAALVRALKAINPDITFEGMGGPLMEQQGVEIWEDCTSNSEMGVSSIASARRWLKRIKSTRQRILNDLPDFVISVDSPDFNLRVVKGLKGKTKTIEYVAPQAWAWREKRKKLVGQLYDHLMVIWPFEVEFFSGFGADVTWVGVPALDHLEHDLETQTAPKVPDGGRAVALLPGSRPREIKLNLDLFVDTAKELLKDYPNLYFLLPRVPGLDPKLFKKAEELGDRLLMQEGGALAVMQKCDLGMAVSGTVTIEGMLLGLPMVMTYELTWIQKKLYVRLMKTKYFTMANILRQKEIIPELILERRTLHNMVFFCGKILDGEDARIQKEEFKEISRELGGAGVAERAAKVVMGVING